MSATRDLLLWLVRHSEARTEDRVKARALLDEAYPPEKPPPGPQPSPGPVPPVLKGGSQL